MNTASTTVLILFLVMFALLLIFPKIRAFIALSVAVMFVSLGFLL